MASITGLTGLSGLSGLISGGSAADVALALSPDFLFDYRYGVADLSTTWLDKSGNGNHCNGVAGLPALLADGVRFRNSDDGFRVNFPSYILNRPYTLFTIGRSLDGVVGDWVILGTSNGGLIRAHSPHRFTQTCRIDSIVSVLGTTGIGQHIAITTCNSGGSAFRIDGVDKTQFPLVTADWDSVSVGSLNSLGAFGNCVLKVWGGYSRVLSEADLALLEAYALTV